MSKREGTSSTLGDRLTGRLGEQLGSVGEYLADQRRQAKLSLRQLSAIAGVSNPYLSQIERGLRKPSAEVLHSLATALQISAGSLYVRAGVLDPDDTGQYAPGVAEAVAADPNLTDKQKRLLLDLYASFVQTEPDDRPARRPRTASSTTKSPGRKPASPSRTRTKE